MKWGKNKRPCGCYSTMFTLEGKLRPIFVFCDKHGKRERLGLSVLEGDKNAHS